MPRPDLLTDHHGDLQVRHPRRPRNHARSLCAPTDSAHLGHPVKVYYVRTYLLIDRTISTGWFMSCNPRWSQGGPEQMFERTGQRQGGTSADQWYGPVAPTAAGLPPVGAGRPSTRPGPRPIPSSRALRPGRRCRTQRSSIRTSSAPCTPRTPVLSSPGMGHGPTWRSVPPSSPWSSSQLSSASCTAEAG